jgi:putative tricarboxylic transport membrane protein
MVIWGLQPGPLLFTNQPDFVWPLIGSFYISNVVAVCVNIAFIPVFLWMLRMPFTILSPLIFVLSLVGTYAAYMDMFDVWLMVLIGIGGFFMRILDYPVAPAVLAIVLGPIAEPTLRQTLLQYETFTIFFTRPIAGPITVIAIILILLPGLQFLYRKFKGA